MSAFPQTQAASSGAPPGTTISAPAAAPGGDVPLQPYLRHAVIEAMWIVLQRVRDDIKSTIDTECPQYHTGSGGHSPRGGPPYMETRYLHDHIYASMDLISPNDTIEGYVKTEALYAAKLEYVMDRPFMEPALNRWASRFSAELSTEMVSFL